MRILKVILTITLFCLLTVLTQIGGLVFLLSILTHKWINKLTTNKFLKITFRITSFLILYSFITFLVVPLIAKPFGRVPLPLTEKNHLQPLNILTCFLNRNYVIPELKQTAFEVAKQMNDKFPGTSTNYLDANFPFIDKFPLIPHLSHNDGKKLDLSFFYRDADTDKPSNKSPSFIGYGVCEGPLPGESNTPEYCAAAGYQMYSYLERMTPKEKKKKFVFDGERTRELVKSFAAHPSIGKIFLEPHLKTRMRLKSGKIRFHGCRSVRHDDHLHVQLR